MALGWLTPRHHSLRASPVCSPGAASRTVPHMSSRSRGCHLEDRKPCCPKPPLVWNAMSPARASQAERLRERVCQAWVPTQPDLPLRANPPHSTAARTPRPHCSAAIPSVERPSTGLLIHSAVSLPSISLYNPSGVPVRCIFSLLGKLQLAHLLPVSSMIVNAQS